MRPSVATEKDYQGFILHPPVPVAAALALLVALIEVFIDWVTDIELNVAIRRTTGSSFARAAITGSFGTWLKGTSMNGKDVEAARNLLHFPVPSNTGRSLGRRPFEAVACRGSDCFGRWNGNSP